jgi:phthalate 4,5-cis-dihydrodiol dehydrogenase
MNKKIQVGILGLGPAGMAMAVNLEADERFAVAAVCDQRPESLAPYASRREVRCHRSLAELCGDGELDAVIIATPTWLHAEHAVAILQSGTHAVVEKPMATSRAEATAMVEASRESGKTLIVGHSHSFEATVRAMRCIIDAGLLGKLRAINAWNYSDWMFRPRHQAEFDRALGGGVVYRQGAHHIDILRFLTRQSPDSILATVGSWDEHRGGDGSYSAFLTFPEKVSATLFYSGYDHFSTLEMTFGLGENGKVVHPSYGTSRRLCLGVSPEAEEARKYGGAVESRRSDLVSEGAPTACFGIVIASCEHGDLRVGPEGLIVYDDTGRWSISLAGLRTGRQAVFDELADVCAGGRAIHDGEWGRANLEVCLAMLDSSEQNMQLHPAFQHQRAADIDQAFLEEIKIRFNNRQPILAEPPAAR